MIAMQLLMLALVPPLDDAAPPSDMAITACARSSAKFCAGVHKNRKGRNMSMSRKTTVWNDGAPLTPIRTSLIDGILAIEVPLVGDTNVRKAKRNCTMEMMVGGS
jgi:hypothetical protein